MRDELKLAFIMSSKSKTTGGGGSLLNSFIDKLPIELHIPTYNYCGPGTKLNKRLRRKDKGINPLDEACKEHDIAYSKFSDIKNRNIADQLLARKAFDRIKSSDAALGEKIAALAVSGVMKAKSKLGMGLKKRGKGLKKRRKQAKVVSFQSAVTRVKRGILGKKYKNMQSAAKDSLSYIKKLKIKEPKKRIIPFPKTGGFLPLLPLFAGLSALGSLGGGAAGIIKAINDAKEGNQKLQEAKRHNQTMETIALGKKGSGLYLKPYKTGCGLYLNPDKKNC